MQALQELVHFLGLVCGQDSFGELGALEDKSVSRAGGLPPGTPTPLGLAIDVFYVVLSLQASYFSLRIIHTLRGGEISRSWWFIGSGMLLFFSGSLFQLYMDATGAYDLLALQPLFASSSALFLAGLYLEYRFWRLSRK